MYNTHFVPRNVGLASAQWICREFPLAHAHKEPVSGHHLTHFLGYVSAVGHVVAQAV